MSLPDHVLARSVEMLTQRTAEQGFDPITLVFATADGTERLHVGDPSSEPVGEVPVSSFEYFRMLVGRRSPAQIAALSPAANPDQLVVFSPAATDIIDPLLR